MSPELSPIIFGASALAISFICRYSLKSYKRQQTFKRADIDDAEKTDFNLMDSYILKSYVPIAVGVLGIITGICSFSALNSTLAGSFLTSMGAAHLVESLIYQRYISHLKVK